MKHLTAEDREIIEKMISENKSFGTIAERIGKSKTTISREIRKRAIDSNKGALHRIPNRCRKRYECNKSCVCPDEMLQRSCRKKLCRCCKHCNRSCKDYQEEKCERLKKPPYVCNGCTEEYRCVLQKRYYIAKKAEEQYRDTLVESRTGANITEAELLALDELVTPLIRKGQSIHHIMASNPDSFSICEKTLYRYIKARMIAARNFDMPRIIRMRPRKQKSLTHKIDKKCKIGRTYSDFLQFTSENPQLPIVEMDTVIGRMGGKVLLTIAFRNSSLFLAYLRERNSSRSVIDVFEQLYAELGRDIFCRLFPVILTDNGSEFSNPLALEFDRDGKRRTRIFYCDPNAAFQKPFVEVSHEFVRRIVPKGHSFDSLTQPDVQRIVNHINSYKREKLNDHSAFDTFSFLYDQDILDRLNVSLVDPNDIVLRPALVIP